MCVKISRAFDDTFKILVISSIPFLIKRLDISTYQHINHKVNSHEANLYVQFFIELVNLNQKIQISL